MKAEIRAATPDDITSIIDMGRAFFDESPFATIAEWDAGSFQATVLSLLSGSVSGNLLVAECDDKLVGMAGYVIFPLYFNMSVFVGQEVFWWCHADYRTGIGGDLMSEMEADAIKGGASLFIQANLAGKRDGAFSRLYRKRGYAPAENTFMRKLSS